jgi:hypothetical protein
MRGNSLPLDRATVTGIIMNAKISPDAASLPAVTFQPHSHRRGSHVQAGSASGNAGGSGIGLLPVGAGAGLFSNLLQSLEQVVGAQAPVAANPASNAAAGGAPAASNPAAQNLDASFTKSLSGLHPPGATRPTVPMGTAANPPSKAQLQSFLNNLAPNSAR